MNVNNLCVCFAFFPFGFESGVWFFHFGFESGVWFFHFGFESGVWFFHFGFESGVCFFSFGFESWVWYLILLVPDHRLSFYYEILWNLAVDVEKVDLGYGGEGKRLEKKINTFIYYFENAYFGMSSEPIHRTAFVWIALLDGEPDRKMVFCAAMCQF